MMKFVLIACLVGISIADRLEEENKLLKHRNSVLLDTLKELNSESEVGIVPPKEWNIEDRVKEAINTLVAGDIKNEDLLYDDLGLGVSTIHDLVLAIEKEFGIKMQMSEFDMSETVQDIIDDVETVVKDITCVLSEWKDTSECSVTCGGGTKTQMRTIINNHSGGECGALSRTLSCLTQPCPKKSSDSDIEDIVKNIIADQISMDVAEMKNEYELMNGLGADELDVVLITMAIEKEFDISISDKAADKFRRVQDILDYLNNTVCTNKCKTGIHAMDCSDLNYMHRIMETLQTVDTCGATEEEFDKKVENCMADIGAKYKSCASNLETAIGYVGYIGSSQWDAQIDWVIGHSTDDSGTTQADKVAIFGLDSAAWTSSTHANSLRLSAGERMAIANAFNAQDLRGLQNKGVFVEGIKYVLLRSDDPMVIYAKLRGHGGITAQRTKQAVIIGHYPEGKNPKQMNHAIAACADYLEAYGYQETKVAGGLPHFAKFRCYKCRRLGGSKSKCKEYCDNTESEVGFYDQLESIGEKRDCWDCYFINSDGQQCTYEQVNHIRGLPDAKNCGWFGADQKFQKRVEGRSTEACAAACRDTPWCNYVWADSGVLNMMHSGHCYLFATCNERKEMESGTGLLLKKKCPKTPEMPITMHAKLCDPKDLCAKHASKWSGDKMCDFETCGNCAANYAADGTFDGGDCKKEEMTSKAFTCAFKSGDGSSTSEKKVSETLKGQACAQECFERGYDGATVKANGSGGCWCEHHMFNIKSNRQYKTCYLKNA